MPKFAGKLVHSLQSTIHRLKTPLWNLAIGNWQLKKGFSLIELLVVIGIIGTIIGGSFMAFNNAMAKGRDQRRKEDLKNLKTALTAYYLDHGSYPPSNSSNTDTEFASDNWTAIFSDLTPTY